MNINRVILAGLLAGIVYFLGDGLVHGVLLKQQWAAILGPQTQQDLHSPVFFLPYDLLKGLAVMWIYAGIRPRFGPGPKTAVLAGLAGWFLVIPVALLGLLPMNFFSTQFVMLWSVYGVVPMVVGALVGGWIYRERGPVR
jgi:hypothetical protein